MKQSIKSLDNDVESHLSVAKSTSIYKQDKFSTERL